MRWFHDVPAQGREALRRWVRGMVCAMGAALLCTAAPAAQLQAEDAAGSARRYETAALERHPEAREIAVPADVAYQRPMRYRAVPLAVVLEGLGLSARDTLEVVALDGFVAQLPGALVLQRAPRPQPWLAIEPAGAPWPALPGKTGTAGPFYIVWPDATGVRSEQWPYAVAWLHVRASPEARWPQITVAPQVPASDARRRGQAIFLTQCFVCHAMNGGGEARVGPDLNLPMSPVEYFQPQALRQLIRDPAGVRRWPGQSMPGFGPGQISDAELDDLLAYLRHMAQERRPAR
ncbi:c-type cytochrome [Paracidovorax anthurii]|uniref:Mono/diheme cytochrome c family protein n=1 Tax=Paracidovorax anthurii TaxID=78229 RepID=A0A328ZI53_9BURK|nr:cytochrome c [Paracidovorax anthurii]RAR85928.1 mono/diheme cytochrome c family protein [Paracidovorax anthurii]